MKGSTRIPIWVRVPGTIALVLVGILTTAMLMGAAEIGRGDRDHDPADGTEMDGGRYGGRGGGTEMDRGGHGGPGGAGHGPDDEADTDGEGRSSGDETDERHH